ncbi:MAG TPA: FG-GAP-like repeat-containing protein [Kofleriaceae bacterium]
MIALAACSGSVDDDGDGYGNDVDCNDKDPSIHPMADETCDHVDNNCDGMIDNDPIDGVSWVADNDGDGYGATYRACEMPAGTVVVAKGGDCKDDDAKTYPGSREKETPLDGIDTDCDGRDYCTDLNCDGLPDVVLPSHYDGDYVVNQSPMLLSGSGGWNLDPTSIDQNGSLGTAVADFNKDGYLDIVYASYSGATGVNTDSFVYWGPDYKESKRTALPTHGAHWPAIADFDGNGFLDIVFADNTDGVATNADNTPKSPNATDSYIYWNRDGAFSGTDRLALATNGATYVSVDDLDGDGYIDIVFSDYADNGVYDTTSYIYKGDATHSYSMAKRISLPTTGCYKNTIVDVDLDGRKDVVMWSHFTGTVHQTNANYIYWNKPETGFSADQRTALQGNGGQRGEVVDLNGDGHLDIIVPGYYNGTMGGWADMTQSFIYWGNAANVYDNTNRTALSTRGAIMAIVGDVNADGHPDILFPSVYDGDSMANAYLFFGNAGGQYNDANKIQLPDFHTQSGSAIIDFDHDGFMDVFLPGYHWNMTGADADPWSNIPKSRIYWGSATGLRDNNYGEWPSRGAWGPTVVGQ